MIARRDRTGYAALTPSVDISLDLDCGISVQGLKAKFALDNQRLFFLNVAR